MNVFENIKFKILSLVESQKSLPFKSKKKVIYNLPQQRLLYLAQNYFASTPKCGNYQFEFLKDDEMDLLFLLRVYFSMYVEVNNELMTVYEVFPRRFKLIKEVNSQNHRHAPKTFSVNSIMHLSKSVYGTNNYLNGIPLSEDLEVVPGTNIVPSVQINYQYIKPYKT
jgi:hypothetical protein